MSQQRTRLILDATHEAFVSMNSHGVITDWNAAAELAFGWRHDEVIGRPLSSVIIPERHRPAHERDSRHHLATGEGPFLSRRIEIDALHRDGHELPVELTIAPLENGGELRFNAFLRDLTERRETEGRLREVARRLEDAEHRARLGHWEFDLLTGETSGSAATERLAGAQVPSFEAFCEFVHPDDRERVRREADMALRGGGAYDTHFRITRPDEETRVMHVLGEVVRSATGRPLRMVATTQDVTERWHAEQEARRLSLDNQAILEAAGEGIVGVDDRGRATFVNRAAAELLGWSPEELLGRSLHEVIHHSRRDGTVYPSSACPIFAAPYDGCARTIEDEVLWRRDGTNFHARCIVAPLVIDEALPPGAVISFNDITERLRAAAALRESEARITALIENTAAAVSLKDLAGRILLVNRTAAELYGTSQADATGRLDSELLAGDDAALIRRSDIEAVELGAPLTVQEEYGTRLGRRTFLTNKFVLRGDDGVPYALAGISTDMTEGERHARELSENRALLRDAQRLGRTGSFIWDTADDSFSVCEVASVMFGLEDGSRAATYEAIIDLAHPADRTRIDATFRQAARDGTLGGVEYRVVRSDGGVRAIFAQGSTQVDGVQSHARLVGVVRDVTDRHRAQEEARRLTQQNEAILLSAGEGIIGVDDRELITFINPAAAKLIGWDVGELPGRSLHEVVHHHRADGTPYPTDACPVLAVLADGTTRSASDEVFWTRDGRPFPVEYITTAIRADEEVVGAVVTFRDISEARRLERQLQHLADHDSLTSLFNRRRFEEELERHVARSARSGSGGAVLLLDLDDFKDVNDTLGHAVGDELLKRVAGLLAKRIRVGDTLARLGGDEFALIVPGVDADEAQAVAADVCAVVRDGGVVAGELRRMRATTSIGIALLESGSVHTAEDLLGYADVALYEAKEDGGDRSRLYSAERQARVDARLTETERIRKALREDLFVLYGQPIVNLETGRADRHELLLRMRTGPHGEVIGPAAFLPTAERLGLIVDIDRWVITEAIALLAERRAAGSRLVVEVNLSGRSLAVRDLPAFIEDQLRSAAVDPSQIIFEITETAAIANMDEARAFAETLTRMGCRMALDDFGSGFATYMYLKYLPVEVLKIDGDFVRNITRDRTDQLVVEAIVNVAQGLGKETIAEGVEDAETADLLRSYGVTLAQGHHMGRPVPMSG